MSSTFIYGVVIFLLVAVLVISVYLQYLVNECLRKKCDILEKMSGNYKTLVETYKDKCRVQDQFIEHQRDYISKLESEIMSWEGRPDAT